MSIRLDVSYLDAAQPSLLVGIGVIVLGFSARDLRFVIIVALILVTLLLTLFLVGLALKPS